MSSYNPAVKVPGARLASLDGMRGVAAIMVALYHWGLATAPLANPATLQSTSFFN
jgi:peptidoglycan/LPS O-acetylase OafA/YrhL